MLTAEKISYFKNLSSEKNLKQFIDNIYKEIDGAEVQLCLHKETSRIIEKVVNSSGEIHCRIFFDRLSGHLEKIAVHRCGSHVIETLLKRFVVFLLDPCKETRDDLPMIKELIKNLLDEIEWKGMWMECFGSHVFRSLVPIVRDHLPDVYSKWMEYEIGFVQKTFFNNTFAVACLQSILHGRDHWSDVLCRMIISKEQPGKVKAMAREKIGSHLIQSVAQVCQDDIFLFLQPIVSDESFRTQNSASFVVQGWLQGARTPEQLIPFLENDPPKSWVSAAAESIVRMNNGYEIFLSKVPIKMKPVKEWKVDEFSLFQKVFLFPNATELMDKMMRLPFSDVNYLATHPQGSFVLEAIFKGHLPCKIKSDFIAKNKQGIHEWACDKYASHLVQVIYDNVDNQKMITEELNNKKIAQSFFGKYVVEHCQKRRKIKV